METASPGGIQDNHCPHNSASWSAPTAVLVRCILGRCSTILSMCRLLCHLEWEIRFGMDLRRNELEVSGRWNASAHH
jgi:hypothetical protein